MRRLLPLALVLAPSALSSAALAQPLAYPDTRRDTAIVDDYHGTRVADPYRWLENTDSPETAAWVAAQNRVTRAHLDAIPERAALETRLTELWNYPRTSIPVERGGRLFTSRNDGLQNQSTVFWQDGPRGRSRVLLDPNALSDDGTVAISGLYPSDDGRYMAYSVSEAGSDWQTIRVRHVASGADLADTLRWVKFSGAAWKPDGSGFYYARYAPPAEGQALQGVVENQKLYFHRLGTAQSGDLPILERPDDPQLGFAPEVTRDGRYLVVSVWSGTDVRNRLYYKDLGRPGNPFVRLLDAFDAAYTFVGAEGSTFYVQTNKDAPNSKLVALDVARPDAGQPASWQTIIPESKAVLESVSMAGDGFVATALDDVKGRLTIHARDGALLRTLELPTLGAVSGVSARAGEDDVYYAFTSYTTPTTVFHHRVGAGATTTYFQPRVAFRPDEFEVKQAFYPSKDGTRVPLFIVHKKGLALDGTNPTYLYGYGGFNISLTPGFSPGTVAWLERGGVYAVANLRGGAEYGETWHEAGMRERKQNVFDDFIAAAEYLVRERYTSPAHLGIGGGSNGGLLVGAAMTQRPELFGAAVPAVGVMDMLRYHTFTIGWAWEPEYGSSADSAAFGYLRAYSPLHNLRAGTRYPATLVTTADHDDRVVPGHSFKFAAALQAAHAGPAPALIRVETRAGHGAGTPTKKVIEAQADVWAFLLQALR